MIHIERASVEIPDVLANPKEMAVKERDRVRKFYADPTNRQKRFPFSAYKQSEVIDALNRLFHSKCAFCESPLFQTAPAEIVHFRPKGSVTESPTHPGYWWLASDWNNLYLSCPDCNRIGKGSRFPLQDENQRAFEPGQESLEEPLLLDPCLDFPENHLEFTPEGIVRGKTLRGNTSIAVFSLNRNYLVDSRLKEALNIDAHLQHIRRLFWDLEQSGNSRKIKKTVESSLQLELEFLNSAMAEASPYAGMKRQIILPFLEPYVGRSTIDDLVAKWKGAGVEVSAAGKLTAQRSYKAFQRKQESYSLEDEGDAATFRLQRQLIEWIEIRNIKAIEHLRLDLTSPMSGNMPWMMLLGENATGKSTILQAVAILLAGASYFQELATSLELQPGDFLRNYTNLKGQLKTCPSGWIKIKLSGFLKPHQLTFRQQALEFKNSLGMLTRLAFKDGSFSADGESWKPQTVLLGYGPTRLLPNRKVTEIETQKTFRVDNLFDPYMPLKNAQKWLLGLKEPQFTAIALVLKDLLGLQEGDFLVRKDDRVMVMLYGSEVPIEQLSSGFQSILALTIDILEVAVRLFPNPDSAEGIVLLDEIGAHLHPTWKMRVVSSLRKAFPGFQFVVTTHEPLCLRGFGKGEVVVLERDSSSRILALSNLPSPADFRIDQLLTSSFFGLNSTLDLEVERTFNEYYALLSNENRSPADDKRLGELTDELRGRRHLGDTQREDLLYEAIDRLLADRKRNPVVLEDPGLKAQAAQQISDLWNSLLGNQPGGGT
jgi:uncharacterized protein (TIGR02646 family)